MIANMDISFIFRTLRTTGILAVVVLGFGWMYFNIFQVLSVFFGMIWGMVNLYFLALLVRSTIRPEGIDKMAALGFIIIKFPLLYLSGYFLLKISELSLIGLLIGFSSLFAVIILKVLGRVIMGLDNPRPLENRRQQQETV